MTMTPTGPQGKEGYSMTVTPPSIHGMGSYSIQYKAPCLVQ
jgi:hypothetical protein